MFPSRVVAGTHGRKLVADRDVPAGTRVAWFDGPVMAYAEVPAEEIRYVLWVGPDQWLIPITDARSEGCSRSRNAFTER